MFYMQNNITLFKELFINQFEFLADTYLLYERHGRPASLVKGMGFVIFGKPVRGWHR